MKKIIFLLLISVASYGQAVFDEGIQLSGNGPTTSTTKIMSQDANGFVNFLNAITLPVSTATQAAIDAATIPDATTTVKGKLKLAGDLGGSADSPTVPGLANRINISEKGAVNGVATLGTDGKVPNNQIPALAISETFPVSSQAQMLALSGADQGDVAIRSDISKSFILRVSPASVLGNWSELLSPTDAVTSVNGQVGVVSLTTANVPDTADKRYQTDNQKLFNDATSSIQTQLNSKANDTNVIHRTGAVNESADGVKTFSTGILLSTESPSTIASFDSSKNLKSLPVATYPTLTELSYVKGVTSAIQTQLNGKQATLTNPVTGIGTGKFIPKFSGSGASTALVDSQIYDNVVGISFGGSTIFGGYEFLIPAFGNNTIYLGVKDGVQNPRAFISQQSSSGNQDVVFGSAFSSANRMANWVFESGNVRISNLSGTGTRQVVTDASGNLSAGDIAPTSGTYTPTLTNIANTSSPTATLSSYTRVGNVVSVSVRFSATESAGVTATSFRVTLPVNRTSNSAVTYIGIGVVFDGGTTGNKPALVSFDTANNSTAVVSYRSSAAFGSVGGNVTFQYTTTE